VVLVNAVSGALTMTLPSAVSTPNRYTIKKIDASANVVTVATTSGQTIDGSPTATLPEQWNRLTLAPTARQLDPGVAISFKRAMSR
jgi:hypothetical protein